MSRYTATPVESAEAIPSFCSDCGRRLVVEDRTAGFDGVTGAPRLVAYAYCRGSWLERVFGELEGHSEYVVSPRPQLNAPSSRAEARREP